MTWRRLRRKGIPSLGEKELLRYRAVQDIARRTVQSLGIFIREGMSENFIAREAQRLMLDEGVTGFWYYDVPALVLVGERTPLSISGKDYVPAEIKVKKEDLVTVDVSPEIDGYWGDYARSFVVLDGKVVDPSKMGQMNGRENNHLIRGIRVEGELHERLLETARPEMTFHELYGVMTSMIEERGFLNLDFKHNLGHSIERNLDDRLYIREGNQRMLGEVALFTFEPHICPHYCEGGFKREDIYYFKRKRLEIL